MKEPPVFQRGWPPIILFLGLMVTLAWMAFLGFKFVELVEKVI
jgi:uncharacterized membrane protein